MPYWNSEIVSVSGERAFDAYKFEIPTSSNHQLNALTQLEALVGLHEQHRLAVAPLELTQQLFLDGKLGGKELRPRHFVILAPGAAGCKTKNFAKIAPGWYDPYRQEPKCR
jgi:hypothetical protein